MLVVTDLYAGYGLSEVLTGTSLQVKAGTVVALIGANGAGKTTTMRAISGMIRPSNGSVTLDGKPVQSMTASKIRSRGEYWKPIVTSTAWFLRYLLDLSPRRIVAVLRPRLSSSAKIVE